MRVEKDEKGNITEKEGKVESAETSGRVNLTHKEDIKFVGEVFADVARWMDEEPESKQYALFRFVLVNVN